jgi:thiol-disulfide isomerase/thioredoxin
MQTERKQPWWKNGWVAGLLILGVLHLTGTAVHVQAGFQRLLLVTGLFHPDIIPVPERAPADLRLSVSDGNGTVFSLADLEGQVRFVNFWATWCAPCLAEMPAISRLHDDYGDRVQFVMVNMDEIGLARDYFSREEFGLTPVVPVSSIPPTFTTGAIPTTVIIDKEGRIAVHESGMADYDSKRFRSSLDRLLSE